MARDPQTIRVCLDTLGAGVHETPSTAGGPHQTYAAMGRGVAPSLPLARRILKHPIVMRYNRHVALVMAINLGWGTYGASAAN